MDMKQNSSGWSGRCGGGQAPDMLGALPNTPE